MPINGKNIHKIPEIGSCFYGDLNLTIRVFTWGLANDLHICKQNMINLKNIILSNFIYECNVSHSAKILQLD